MDPQAAPTISPEYLEQNPLVAIALTVFMLVFAAFVSGAIASWIFMILRFVQGQPILTPEPWQPRVWGFVDLVIAVVFILIWQRQSAMIGCSVLGIDRQQVAADSAIPLPLATILGLGNIAAMLTICLWIVVRHRASLAQLGFGFARWWKHIAIGAVAALACLPLVYALMAAVSIGFDNKYSHPLLDELKREGSLSAYLLAVTSAVIIAPLVEEFLFRVIIQGWLQSVPFSSLKAIFLGRRAQPLLDAAPLQPELLLPPDAHAIAPLVLSLSAQTAESSPAPAESNRSANTPEPHSSFTPPIWPAFVTGTLFGLAHLGYGLSFIPLILLGILLGLLYRATHSIWPSLVVHVILNGSSMLALGVSILIERAAAAG
jgi:membrane protease YdiL (CAAX protease family)